MDHRVQCNFPEFAPMVGFAATACFRADAPPAGGDAYGSIQLQLEMFEQLPGPSIVVFEDIDDPAVAAVFGEVMCSTYKAYGSVGLVTNGGGRDLEQVRALGYPVFTGSTICSHAYCHMLHLGLPDGGPGRPAAWRCQRGHEHSAGDCLGGSRYCRRLHCRRGNHARVR